MLTARDQLIGTRPDSTSKPSRVLRYGHDILLLHSRQRILQLAGCPSELASTANEFQDEVNRSCPGVIVLCQTIALEEGILALAFAHQHCPATSLLLLYNQRRKFTPVQEHHYFQSCEGPRAFAATVFQLLYASKQADSGQSESASILG